MQKLRCHLAGAHVEARGEPWVVLRAEAYEACTLVTLRGTGDENLGTTTELIAPFDRVETAARTTRIRRVSRRTVLQTVAAAIACAHGWSESWAAPTARMDLLPWQLEPARSAVSGETRLLLADGVGLGKTVQAGLILAELRARGFVRRALVLTPASLREQWAAELHDRFALDSLVLDHGALTRLAAELPPGINPWSVAAIAISSIDLVKRGEVRRALDAIPFDLLIVDEAHHLRPGTDRGALVADLASRAPWLVLATATPHSGDEQDYAYLRSLGSIGHTGNIATFHRTSEVASRPSTRRVVFQAVRVTERERHLLDETLAYGKAVWRAHKALVAAVICRRAASSPAALLRTLRRRHELLTCERPAAAAQAELPWQEGDERDAVESDEMLAGARLSDATLEREWLEALIRLIHSLDDSSKVRAIERLLTLTNEPLIVFSEYRDTLAFLNARLSHRTTLAVIHGGLSARERRDSIHRFVSGGARILLATDAAGEGLNLQHRCRLVLNMELPWNPLRLEQRIGRVDRIGQTRRVHAIQLLHRETFEDQVLARFEKRLQRARRGLSGRHFDEHAVAAAIFQGTDLAAVSRDQAAQFVQVRVRDASLLRRRARALVGSSRSIRAMTQTVCAAPPSRQRLTARVALLFECDFHDDGGRLVARDAIALAVEFDRRLDLRRDHVCRVAALLAACADVRRRLEGVIQQRRTAVADEAERASAAIQQRLEGILTAIDCSQPAPVQTSLFDKRSERQARRSEAAAAQIRDHMRRRLDAALALRHVHPSAPRLIAVWPL